MIAFTGTSGAGETGGSLARAGGFRSVAGFCFGSDAVAFEGDGGGTDLFFPFFFLFAFFPSLSWKETPEGGRQPGPTAAVPRPPRKKRAEKGQTAAAAPHGAVSDRNDRAGMVEAPGRGRKGKRRAPRSHRSRRPATGAVSRRRGKNDEPTTPMHTSFPIKKKKKKTLNKSQTI